LDIDAIVLEGPMLTVDFPALWEETFAALTARGTKIILIGAAMFRFNEDEKRVNREFLSKYRPWILSSRDFPTYEAFKDLADHAHAGLDSAFFVPKAYEPFKLETEPYVAMNFDRWHEPAITVDNAPLRENTRDFQWEGKTWHLEFPERLMNWSHKNKWWSYIASFCDRRKLVDEIAGMEVVRPEHRFNPHITPKVYKRPNAVASDEPWTYFTVYANADLTVSDRVHACIVTLAYGKPAILFSPSPRSQVFDRLGLSDIRKQVVTLPYDVLEKERTEEIDFLRKAALA
jgi:polysaccharide pyruvyl transferase WcaK-like protein